jgi:hypothetical protein
MAMAHGHYVHAPASSYWLHRAYVRAAFRALLMNMRASGTSHLIFIDAWARSTQLVPF